MGLFLKTHPTIVINWNFKLYYFKIWNFISVFCWHEHFMGLYSYRIGQMKLL